MIFFICIFHVKGLDVDKKIKNDYTTLHELLNSEFSILETDNYYWAPLWKQNSKISSLNGQTVSGVFFNLLNKNFKFHGFYSILGESNNIDTTEKAVMILSIPENNGLFVLCWFDNKLGKMTLKSHTIVKRDTVPNFLYQETYLKKEDFKLMPERIK